MKPIYSKLEILHLIGLLSLRVLCKLTIAYIILLTISLNKTFCIICYIIICLLYLLDRYSLYQVICIIITRPIYLY